MLLTLLLSLRFSLLFCSLDNMGLRITKGCHSYHGSDDGPDLCLFLLHRQLRDKMHQFSIG